MASSMMEIGEEVGPEGEIIMNPNDVDVDARTSLCVICSNTSTPYAGGTPIIYDGVVASGLRQVFKHLLQRPFQEVEELYNIVTRRSLICHKCSEVVKQIYEDHQRILTLQVLVQHKAEALGEIIRINVDDTASEDLEVNKEFRGLVKQNYAEGRLPNLAVRLSPYPKIYNNTSGSGGINKIPVNGELETSENEEEEEEEEDMNEEEVEKRIKTEPVESREDELPCEYICPKCECSFSAGADVDRSLVREQFYRHYLAEHSPVREEDVSIDEEGRNCYKCTICPFSTPIDEIPGRILDCAQEALDRLMEHIVGTHEAGDDSAQETFMVGGDLVKDLDYFICPEQDCPFVVYVTDVNGFEDFKEKSRLAVTKLCNHSIFVHAGTPSSVSTSGNSMIHPCFVAVNEKRGSFKCFKCDFKLEFNLSSNEERQTALRTFNNHYVSHIKGKEIVPIESIKCPLCSFVTRRELDVTTVLKYPSEQGQILVRNMNNHFTETHRGKEIPKFATVRKNLVPLAPPTPPSNASSSSSNTLSSNVELVPAVNELEVVDITEDEHGSSRIALADEMRNKKQLHCPAENCGFKVIKISSLWKEQRAAINKLISHYTEHISSVIGSVLVDPSQSLATRTYKCTMCQSAEADSLRNLAEHYFLEHLTIAESTYDGSCQQDWEFEMAQESRIIGVGTENKSQSVNSNNFDVTSTNATDPRSPNLQQHRPTVIKVSQSPVTIPHKATVVPGYHENGTPTGTSTSNTPIQNEVINNLTDVSPTRKRGRPPGSGQGQRVVGRPRRRGTGRRRRRRNGRRVLASRPTVKITAPTLFGVIKRGRGRPRKIRIKQEPLEAPIEESNDNEAIPNDLVPHSAVVNGDEPRGNSGTEIPTDRESPISAGDPNSHRYSKRTRKRHQIPAMLYMPVLRKSREKRRRIDDPSQRAISPILEGSQLPPNKKLQENAIARRGAPSKQRDSVASPVVNRTATEEQPEEDDTQMELAGNSEVEARLGYQCPKCDLSIEFHERSKTSNSRQRFNRHYVVEHSPVTRKDPVCSEPTTGKQFYPCKECSHKSYLCDKEEKTLVMRKYIARFKLGVHYLQYHEGKGASELVDLNCLRKPKRAMSKPESLDIQRAKKNIYSCPMASCQFTAADDSAPKKFNRINRLNLMRHYAKHFKDIEVKRAGPRHYLQCHKCESQFFLKLTTESESDNSKYCVARYKARLEMSDHMLSVHENMPDTINDWTSRRRRGRKPRSQMKKIPRGKLGPERRRTGTSETQSEASYSSKSRTSSVGNPMIRTSIATTSGMRSPVKEMVKKSFDSATGCEQDKDKTPADSSPPELPRMPRIKSPIAVSTRRPSFNDNATSPKLRKMCNQTNQSQNDEEDSQQLSTDLNARKELPISNDSKGTLSYDSNSKNPRSPTPRGFPIPVRPSTAELQPMPME